MATKRVKDLPLITVPVGSDLLPVDGTTTRTISVDNLFRHRFPASGIDNRAVRFDGTSGLVQGSNVEIDDSGRVRAGAGTAALPALSFAGDTDTGWFNVSANVMAAAVNGTEVARVDAGGLSMGGAYVAPRPSASGVGHWLQISSVAEAALSLPPGGTWAYFVLPVLLSTGGVTGVQAGTEPGGTLVGAATAGVVWLGFAWRVT